ncbi:hypothetical protein D3C81_2116650 [compost metagenome]
MFDAMVIDHNAGHQPVFFPLLDLDAAAPWQKLRIILNPVYQRKHLFSAVAQQD